MSFSEENRSAIQMQMHMPNQSLRQRVQCCSLCRQRGHNITTCNSDRLLEFEVICADAVRNFENTDDFKNWLMHNYINDQLLLKAFVIRKYRISTRCNLEQYIHFITEYIFRAYKNTPQQQQSIYMQTTTPLQQSTAPLQQTTGPLQEQPLTYDQNVELLNRYETEFSNYLTAIRSRNTVREQMLEQQIAEIDVVRSYIAYLAYLNALILREEIQQPTLTLTVETNEEENLDENCQCNICWDNKEKRQFAKLECNHEFCKDCMKRTIETRTNETRTNLCCALCRSEITTIRLRTQEVRDEIAEAIA
jgi:hypothetical protein